MDIESIVPGHGPVGGKDELRLVQRYLRLVHEESRRHFDAGASTAEATDAIDVGEFAAWAEPERLGFNVSRCYQEFRGEISPQDVSALPAVLSGNN